MSRHQLDRAAECDRILHYHGADRFETINMLLERQFAVLHNRAQVLLGLCGIVITTTGFSGRLIAGTNRLGQALIVTGIALVLAAAAVVVWGVLHLRWLTQQLGDDVRAWLLTVLAYRDAKTEAYRVGIVLLLGGLVFYVASIAVMLFSPHAGALPPR